jgi:tetratricopeptide (TPR) repeat protein
MADRYAYIPFIGLLVAIVWALRGLVVRYRIAAAWPAIAAVCVASIFGCLTYRQLGYWQNDEKLWRYTLSVTERNYMAHDNLALALAEQGRPDEAVAEFRAATLLHQYPPGQVVALALYELRVGHLVEAVEACESVLRSSHDPQILSVAWSERGQASLELRHYDQAAESFRNALQFNPRDPVALVGSGLLALREGQVDAAVAEFAHAVGVDASAANFLLLEQALRRARRFAEADSALAQARKVSPDLNAPRIAVGQILSFVGLAPL